MPRKKFYAEVPAEKLRWRVNPADLPFENTNELEGLKEIIGQKRGVESLKFGIGMGKRGYNVFVTGAAGTGRMSTVRKLLNEISKKGQVPDDLCYVNNFKNPEAPVLLHFKGGTGSAFRENVKSFVDSLRKEIPQFFESQEYINAKKQITETYEQKAKGFFKDLDQKVKDEGFTLVDVQLGQYKRPEVMPLIDGNPTPIDQVESMVERGRYPREEFEKLKKKYSMLKEQIEQIFLDLRDLQKDVQEKIDKMDRAMFMDRASQRMDPLKNKYKQEKIQKYLDSMLNDMADNLHIFKPQGQGQQQVLDLSALLPQVDWFQPYRVNLIVDNSEQKGTPVIIESYPTYKNIFGSIERVVDRSGVWRTDFSKIKAGSLLKANGGYLVFNLLDAIMEPGVWPALKRALKSQKLEIQTYDPYYLFTTSGLKPEPIELDTKVIVISDPYLYHLLLYFDEDVKKIFKVRADFGTSMDKNQDSIHQVSRFIKMITEKDELRPFDRTAAAGLIEEAVKMTERQEKISTSFPALADLIREADYWAGNEGAPTVEGRHVDKAIQERMYRSNRVEEYIQEMIDRGTLMIDVDGEEVGQVNGLSVYDLEDFSFGKPTRITASTSMGRTGIINIEREADMSGNTHNKGVLILSGYLRKKYAQEKPLTMSASIAFEQSYAGVDGDSASSTELYALLSSLSGIPIKQYIAVTGSVNQKGEVQAIGGVNEKIEGFYDCCQSQGLNKKQGVIIPEANINDLMLRKDVISAVEKREFHIYPVKTIDQGIEILTGKKAGAVKPDGTFPKGTVNYMVDRKLQELAEEIKRFGEEEEEEEKRERDEGPKPGKGISDDF